MKLSFLEWLIVLVVIGIVLAVAIPNYQHFLDRQEANWEVKYYAE